jgi:SAM-dependent methyltransferase
MLDLIRLSPRSLFPPGGRELYRQIALLTDMDEGSEVLVASCGTGLTLEFFVREFGVQGSGVDEDPVLIEEAETRIRESGLQNRIQLQCGSMESLPYRDGVFDVVVAELGLTASADPMKAIGELARVVRAGGRVALVHLVWKAPVDRERREVLSRHLGARPLMLVELKRGLQESGVRNLHSEAWSDESTAFRPHVKKPFPDFAELFSLPEKLGILRRAWSRWGWRGVGTALAREREVHRLLTRERILGLDLVKGTRVVDPDPELQEDPDGEPQAAPEPDDAPNEPVEEDLATLNLPLFRGGGGDP